MSTHRYKADPVEMRFLQQDVMQVHVLTHAQAFQHFGKDEFEKSVEQGVKFAEETLSLANQISHEEGVLFKQGVVQTSPALKKAWQGMVKEGWTGLTTSQKWGGKGLPESVVVAIQEAFDGANPALSRLSLINEQLNRLIDAFGTEEQKETYCSGLANGTLTAALSLSEPLLDGNQLSIRTTAKAKEDYYLISGTKTMVFAGDHDLTENILHVVVSKVTGAEEGSCEYGLFLVPKYIPHEESLIENNISVDKIHTTMGMKSLPCCSISYGKEGECRGTLLCILDQENPETLLFQQGIRLQAALRGVALSGATTALALKERENGVLSLEDPITSDYVVSMQTMVEGLRGAVYATAFYKDCKEHGGDAQKPYFADLTELHALVLKAYGTERAMEILQQGMKLFGVEAYGDDYPLEQNYQDLLADLFLGGSNHNIAQEFLSHTLMKNEGRAFKSLLQEFEMLDMDAAKSDQLHEAVGVWRDYLGGAIVLCSEMQGTVPGEEESEEGDEGEKTPGKEFQLHADKVLKLFGDLIVGFHLIRQGLAAEKELKKMNVNFFNVQLSALKDFEIRPWYNKLVFAQYFALNVLSQQEGAIRMIQKNNMTSLDVLFESEEMLPSAS